MRRFSVLALLLVLVALTTTADSFTINVPSGAARVKQFRIAANDATNPQTISWFTTYGYYAKSWTVTAPGGGCMMKIHGVAGTHPYYWLYIPSGESFTMPEDAQQPLDSVIVLRDATTSGFYIVGSGKP